MFGKLARARSQPGHTEIQAAAPRRGRFFGLHHQPNMLLRFTPQGSREENALPAMG